jgi:transcriptional regulator with XRE-family HTH domain
MVLMSMSYFLLALRKPMSKSILYGSLGDWLKAIRKARGFSLRALAGAAGISHVSVDKAERGGGMRDSTLRLVVAALAGEGAGEEEAERLFRAAKMASAGLADKSDEMQIDVAELLSLYSSLSPERKIRVLEKAADQYMMEQYEAREEMSRK